MLKRYTMGPLMMPAGAGSGSGSGAGADPNPGAPAFDASAFEAKILEAVNKGINALDKKINGLAEKIAAKPPAADPANPGPNPDPSNPNPNPEPASQEPPKTKTTAELTLELTRLQRQIEAERKARETSEKATQEKEAQLVEEKRKATFMDAIADLQFAVGKDGQSKARQQFIDAYLPKVVRDKDTGEFVVPTEAGPVTVKQYLQAEFEASPHFAAPQGHGGAGASGGSKVGSSKMPDYQGMTASQISAIPAAERDAHLAELVHSLHP